MSRPRGRRTRQVATYLAEVELAAWDVVRSLEQGLGWYPPSRAAWIVEQVVNELHWFVDNGSPAEAARAQSTLDTLAGEPIGWVRQSQRSHGRLSRPRKPAHRP
jgi:hypothetical protein